ncbi:MAG TPA: regulatory protein RecX [Candidatus Deferrimicrobiaceae bacterium]|jgi:regulatory protein
MAVALGMLSRRAVSEGELLRRLSEKGFSAAEAEAVVSRLRELGLADDRKLCEGLVRVYRESRRYGRAKILMALRRRLIPADLIDDVVRVLSGGDEELDAASAALSKKFREGIPPGREGISKAYRFLASRGFSLETCRRALGKKLTENDDDDEGDA